MAHHLQSLSCLFCKSRKDDEEDVFGIEEAISRGIAAAAAPPTAAAPTSKQYRTKEESYPSSSCHVPKSQRSSSSSNLNTPVRVIPHTIRFSHEKKQRHHHQAEKALLHKEEEAPRMTTMIAGDVPVHAKDNGPAHCSVQPLNDDDATSSPLTFYQAMQAADTSAAPRRRSKRFHNIHPAHAKIKAKLDIFEGRHSSSIERTESTDLTESETMDSSEDNNNTMLLSPVVVPGQSFRRRRSSLLAPGQERQVIDCENDPYAAAYKVWYNKGMLYFRPKGLPERFVE